MAHDALTLAHSPDPDDAFMWWPITGKIQASARGGHAAIHSPPVLPTDPFVIRAVPLDIETLNRHAMNLASGAGKPIGGPGAGPEPRPAAGVPHESVPHAPFDITALSLHAYSHVAADYALTSCGGSFGDGYGPRVIAPSNSKLRCEGCLRDQRPVIAVPGARTTAFLVLTLCLGGSFRFVEMPFDLIADSVEEGRVDAGLIIHEGQVTLADRPFRQILDLGAWWKDRTGLPLPLGVNAIRRDLDARFGPGTTARVADLLRRSVAFAMDHREEGLDYAMGFALAGNDAAGATRERIGRFVDMYVNGLTRDMGDRGREAIRRLLDEGAAAHLCPKLASVDVL